MRHGYLRAEPKAITAARGPLEGKSSADLADLVESSFRTVNTAFDEMGPELKLDKVKVIDGPDLEGKAENLNKVIVDRAAAQEILSEREEVEAAKQENEAANQTVRTYRRGPRVFTPEQVEQLARAQRPAPVDPYPASTKFAKACSNFFGATSGSNFLNKFNQPFWFESGVLLKDLIEEPVNAITATQTMRPGTGETTAQPDIGYLRFPPLQMDIEYYARRQTSVYAFLSRRSRTLPTEAGGAYRYTAETAPTGTAPAARVAAGVLSAREFGTEIRTANLEVMGAWVPVAREEFLDVPGFSMFLNTVLRDDVMLAVDNQLLNGTGTAPQIRGLNEITNRQKNPMAPASGVTEYGTTEIHSVMTSIFSSGHAMADFIIMNPTDWHSVRTHRDGEKRLQMGSELIDIVPMMFGLPVIRTPAQPAGTVFVGTSSKLMMLEQGGVIVEWTNAHDDGFTKLIDAVRGHCRIGLVSRRDTAQGTVSSFAAEETG